MFQKHAAVGVLAAASFLGGCGSGGAVESKEGLNSVDFKGGATDK